MAKKEPFLPVKSAITLKFDFRKMFFYYKSAFNENLNTIFTHSNLIDLRR